jgi:hypothetical protein
MDEDKMLELLNRIALGENNEPFTKADVEKFMNGGFILSILPKIGPVKTSEAVEAYRAAQAVLQAL